MTLKRAWPVLALLALLLVLGETSQSRLSITYDEFGHLLYGMRVMAGNTDRFDDSKMPVSALNALPLTLRGIGEAQLDPRRAPLEEIRLARHATVWASAVLALVVFAWACELYGYAAGLLALGLYVLEPNLLAHGQLVTTDLYAALFLTLALYTYWRFLARPGRGRLVVSALALGLAQVAKYTAAYLHPLYLLLGFIWWWRQPDRARLGKSCLAAAAVHVAASLLVINAAFLFNHTGLSWGGYAFKSSFFRGVQHATAFLGWAPVPLPYPYLQGLDLVKYGDESGTGFGSIYLLGELRHNQGFPAYYLVAFLFKTPLALQALLAWAAVRWWRTRERRSFWRDELVLLVPVAFFTVYFDFFFKAQIGLRYFLVAYPLLIVFAGSLAADWPGLGRRARLAGAGLVVWMAASNLYYFGHYLTYFNELIGPRTNAYKVLADSNLDWGQNILDLQDYLRAHPDVTRNPPEPVPGHYIVDVNIVAGIDTARPGHWVHFFAPTGQVAFTYLLYDITTADLERALRQLRKAQ
jgi:4-amino-4-deoxy-L-arabinose transferase-like glycosyltransferase